MQNETKLRSIRMSDDALKGLKLIGVHHDMKIGNVITALVELFHLDEAEYITDQQFKDQFRQMKLTALANAGLTAGYIGHASAIRERLEDAEGGE